MPGRSRLVAAHCASLMRNAALALGFKKWLALGSSGPAPFSMPSRRFRQWHTLDQNMLDHVVHADLGWQLRCRALTKED